LPCHTLLSPRSSQFYDFLSLLSRNWGALQRLISLAALVSDSLDRVSEIALRIEIATKGLENQRIQSLQDIKISRTEAVNEIKTGRIDAVNEIKSKRADAITAIGKEKNLAIQALKGERDKALTAITTALSTALAKIAAVTPTQPSGADSSAVKREPGK
jgi:hypothetical protein